MDLHSGLAERASDFGDVPLVLREKTLELDAQTRIAPFGACRLIGVRSGLEHAANLRRKMPKL